MLIIQNKSALSFIWICSGINNNEKQSELPAPKSPQHNYTYTNEAIKLMNDALMIYT